MFVAFFYARLEVFCCLIVHYVREVEWHPFHLGVGRKQIDGEATQEDGKREHIVDL